MPRGRKAKPTEQLKDQGTYRKDRHEDRLEISIPLQTDPAEWLTDEEKAIWTKWYGVLQQYDVLKETDEVAFGLLCKVFRRTQVLSEEFRNGENLIIDHVSDVGAKVQKENPKFKILVASEATLLKLLTEFGMTPASRSKVKSAVKEGEDPFEAAMKSA